MGEYRVVASNPATASENRIHSDEVARRHGFRGGLVPGVTVYAYVVHALVDAFGPGWVATGRAGVRFRSPCYDGDHLTIRLSPGERGSAELEVTSGKTTCVTGSASLSGDGEPGPEGPGGEVPAADLPARAERPAASAERLAPGVVLGSVPLETDLESAAAYLEKVGETSSLYADRNLVHPGMILEGANRILAANVVLPPWLHVGSEVTHLRAVEVGEPVSVQGRVAKEWEHRGHRFVALDVVWMVGPEAVARARHTAIWRLAVV
jgi:hypothetical protein